MKQRWPETFSEWRVATGYFGRIGQEHSWLYRMHTPDHPALALDMYPVASLGGPLVVDISSIGSPWNGLYIEDVRRYCEERLHLFDVEAKVLLELMTKTRAANEI
ncbi:MAG: hypothetical protein AAB421_00440 [Patescibacteria group bacterium]